MKVLFVSSEVSPFAKTGGLADVAGSLPKSLKKNGIEVKVIMPLYKTIKNNFKLEKIENIKLVIILSEKQYLLELYKSKLPGSDVEIIFIYNENLFDRMGLYGNELGDYDDNFIRFIVFQQGVLSVIKSLDFKPDIIHCNDWQTSLIPVYLFEKYKKDNFYKNIKTVLTIHNLAYQGLFWHWDMVLSGLSWDLFNSDNLEFYGKINFLKGGIVFSDIVTTVSETYAEEIQTETFGCGLDGVILKYRDKLSGILNGVDYNDWNPEIDKLIPYNYNIKDLKNKYKCKSDLQKKSGLKVDNKIPVLGFIGRLVEQKGIKLIIDSITELLNKNLQIIILGSGDNKIEEALIELSEKYPDKLKVFIKFDNALAHLIEAGTDIYLMPSEFEPCGLNQIYSLKYGSIPVVHKTGGLADTIIDVNEKGISAGTGFTFEKMNSSNFMNAVDSALDFYNSDSEWNQIMKNAMSQDFSWNKSSKKYIELYKKINV